MKYKYQGKYYIISDYKDITKIKNFWDTQKQSFDIQQL